MDIMIGADPELFVRKGLYKVSAHNLLPGTKKDPVKVEGGAIQVDGTAAEFNVDPCSTAEEFKTKIALVSSEIDRRLKALDPSYRLDIVPVRQYPAKRWSRVPDSAKELGCDPDFNAYTGEMNPRPVPPTEGFRSAGGHVHVGWGSGMDIEDPDHVMDCRLVIKGLDSVLYQFSSYWDTDEKRRQIYGKPGAYRPKSYGVEYRVLSNAWLKDPVLIEIVFRGAKLVASELENSPSFSQYLFGIKYYNKWSTPYEYLSRTGKEEYNKLENMLVLWRNQHAVR